MTRLGKSLLLFEVGATSERYKREDVFATTRQGVGLNECLGNGRLDRFGDAIKIAYYG